MAAKTTRKKPRRAATTRWRRDGSMMSSGKQGAGNEHDDFVHIGPQYRIRRSESARGEIERLTLEIERLRAALKPFADRADAYDLKSGFSPTPDYGIACCRDISDALPITVGELRAARHALDQQEPKGD